MTPATIEMTAEVAEASVSSEVRSLLIRRHLLAPAERVT